MMLTGLSDISLSGLRNLCLLNIERAFLLSCSADSYMPNADSSGITSLADIYAVSCLPDASGIGVTEQESHARDRTLHANTGVPKGARRQTPDATSP